MNKDIYYKEITLQQFQQYKPLHNFNKDMYVQGGKYAEAVRNVLGCDTLLPVSKTLKVMDSYNFLSVWSLMKDENGIYLESARTITGSKGFVICECPYQKKDIKLLRFYVLKSK